MPFSVHKDWGWFLEAYADPKINVRYLYVVNGRKSSLHYHNSLYNSFFIIRGILKLTVEEKSNILTPGQRVVVECGKVHRFMALEDTEIIEVAYKILDDGDPKINLNPDDDIVREETDDYKIH